MRQIATNLLIVLVACLILIGCAASPSAQVGPFNLSTQLYDFFAASHAFTLIQDEPGESSAVRKSKAEARKQFLQRYNLASEDEWKRISSDGFAFAFSDAAAAQYGSSERVLELRRAATSGKSPDQYRSDRQDQSTRDARSVQNLEEWQNPKYLDPKLLEPVSGLSLERYAQASRMLIDTKGDWQIVTQRTGVSRALYESAGAVWMERMKQDRSSIVAQRYSVAYARGGASNKAHTKAASAVAAAAVSRNPYDACQLLDADDLLQAAGSAFEPGVAGTALNQFTCSFYSRAFGVIAVTIFKRSPMETHERFAGMKANIERMGMGAYADVEGIGDEAFFARTVGAIYFRVKGAILTINLKASKVEADRQLQLACALAKLVVPKVYQDML